MEAQQQMQSLGAGPPQDRPGVTVLMTRNDKGLPTYTEHRINVGTDREAQATALGFHSFAAAPAPIRDAINVRIEEKALRISQEQGLLTALGRNRAEQQFVLGGDATHWMHPGTGASPSGDITVEQARALGYVKLQHPADRNALADLMSTKATVSQLSQMADRLITATTPFDAGVQGAKLHAAALTKTNPLATTYQDTKTAFLGTLSRSLGGERGVLTNQDIGRVANSLAGFFDTVAVKDAKNAILNNLLQTATEAKIAAMTGQPMGEQYKQRIDLLLKTLEGMGTPGASPPPGNTPKLGEPGYTGVTNSVPRGSAPVGKIMLEGADGTYSYWPATKAIPPGAKRVD
jgi:hypothetical protein